jgi:hypothetical protein
MNGFILLLAFISLLLNIVFSHIFDVYPIFSMKINCVVIAFTTVILFVLRFLAMATAFRISLYGLFSFLGLAMIALGILSPEKWESNGYVIAICIIMAFEAIVLTACNVVSKLNGEAKNGRIR